MEGQRMSERRHGRVGIEKIAAYPCTLSLDMRALAEARGADPAHPLDELWVASRSLNPVWEDPVTMAVNAALKVVSPEDREKIELIIVGTESSPDFGKPMSTYVQRHCGIGPNCRNFETKHACYGGTSAVMMAAHWIATGVRPGAKALVVTADQSRTHIGKPWEYVLGAASAAMLISDQPDLFEFELGHNGYWTQEIFDTYRPTSTKEVGHADTSLFGYLEASEGSFDNFMERSDSPNYDEYFKKHIYHVPFGGMTYRAHRAIMRRAGLKLKNSEMRAHFERKSKPALRYNRSFGGTYTSATFIAMMGLVDGCDDLVEGDRVSVFSYGSGSCAEFYPLVVGPRAHEVVAEARLAEGLASRREVSVEEYEAIEAQRSSHVDQSDFKVDHSALGSHYAEAYEGRGLLVLDAVEEYERKYRLS
jgi:hydroxymethylglutaryl-CoA synthase